MLSTHPKARRQIEALGARLRAARLRRGMTQEALAERVGVSIPTLGKLEAGDPSTSLATVLRALTALKRPRARRKPAPSEPSTISPHES